MVNAPKPLPEDLGVVFARRSALALGVTDRRLRAKDLVRPFHGVRRLDAPVGALDASSTQELHSIRKHEAEVWKKKHLQTADDYCAVMRDHQFFSGWTAAVIWKLPIPFHLVKGTNYIEVGTFAPRTPPRGAGVKGTQFRTFLACAGLHDGKRVLNPASVWATVGPRLSLPDRIALGDAVIRMPRYPGNFCKPEGVRLGTLEELTVFADAKGRPGRRLLLESLPLLRDGAASAPESHLRLALTDAGLPEPQLDVDVYDDQGRFLGCSELAYPEFKLAIEYEGDHHRTETEQWDRDIQKYEDYKQAGWEVTRVTRRQLYLGRRELIQQIRRSLMRKGWQNS